MRFKIILYLLVFCLLSFNVYALAIHPAVSYYDFQPNLANDLQFTIVGESEPFSVKVLLSEELGNYMVLYDGGLLVVPPEGKDIRFSFELPENLDPGKHRGLIIVEKTGTTDVASGTGMGAFEAVGYSVIARVPYPGKYAEIIFRPGYGNVNGSVLMEVDVYNYGSEMINQATGFVEIYDKDVFLDRIDLSFVDSIAPKEYKTLRGEWNSTGNPAGEYVAKATVLYDDKSTSAEKMFLLGFEFIEILDINPKIFKFGEISAINVDLKSNWNALFRNVEVEMHIFDNGILIERLLAPSIKLVPPLGEFSQVLYWNPKVAGGEYEAKVVVSYNNKLSERIFDIFVEPGVSPLRLTLILVVVVVVLLAIVYIVLKKHGKI